MLVRIWIDLISANGQEQIGKVYQSKLWSNTFDQSKFKVLERQIENHRRSEEEKAKS